MTKKKIDFDKYASGLFLRTEQYVDRVRKHYASAVNELLKISANAQISPEETFSFANNKRISNKANEILRSLYSAVYHEIKNGVLSEWEYANLSCDALIESIFGKGLNEDNHFARWFSRNQEAIDAFFKRKSAYGGMNLSQKVWKYTGDLKTEMELALSLSLGQGDSASKVSREVRKYLQEPERLFRRIKVGVDTNGKPIYKLSKAAKAYHPGRGVYRSSYKNAMRLTRTETNMAYKTAEQDRWQRLDFVVGYEIKTSNNHPEQDICDELKGKYPKDFVFKGWHPQCRCYVVPILAKENEFVEMQKQILAGEDPTVKSVNIIRRPGQKFYDWWDNNKERVETASSMPYWVQDNQDYINKKRKIRIKTDEEREAIRKKWAERAKKYQLITKMANNVLKVAQEYPEINLTALQSFIDKRNIGQMNIEARTVAKQIADIKKREKAITDLIPDAHALIKQFSIAELEKAHSSINKTLQRWDWNFDSMDNLKKIQGALKYEVGWMETKGKKYATWQVSRDAYKRKLELVEHRIRMLEVKDDIASQLQFVAGSKSKPANLLVQEFNDLFSVDNTDIAVLKNKAEEIKKKVHQLEVSKALRERKKTPTAFVPKTDEATKKDFIDWVRSKGISIQERDVVVDNGFIHLQSDQHQKIYEALKPETDAERTQLWNRVLKTQRTWRAGYVRTSNSFNINRDFRQTGVTGVIDKAAEAKLRANGMTADDIKTSKLLDKKISEFSLPVPIRVTRYVEPEALPNIFGEAIDVYEGSRFSERKTLDSIIKSKKEIRSDPAYLSASTNEDQNVFTHFDIKLEIEVPPNTPFYLTNNYIESEVVFGRSTKLQFISAKNKGGYVVVRARMIQ